MSNNRAAKRAKVSLHRVAAEIQVHDTKEVLQSRVFLNDLNQAGVGLFCNTQITVGDMVSVVIKYPKNLFVKGKVMWCQPYTLNTKVLSSETYKYRIGVKFVYEEKEEEDSVKSYCDEIANLE